MLHFQEVVMARKTQRDLIWDDVNKNISAFISILDKKIEDNESLIDEQVSEIQFSISEINEIILEYLNNVENGEDDPVFDKNSDDTALSADIENDLESILSTTEEFVSNWIDRPDLLEQVETKIRNLRDRYDWFSHVRAKINFALNFIFEIKNNISSSDIVSNKKSKFEEMEENLKKEFFLDSWPELLPKIVGFFEAVVEFAESEESQFISPDSMYWPQTRHELKPLEMVETYVAYDSWKKHPEDADPFLGYIADEMDRLGIWNELNQLTDDTTSSLYSFMAWCKFWIPSFDELLPLYVLEKIPLPIFSSPTSSDPMVEVMFPSYNLPGDWYRIYFYIEKASIREDFYDCGNSSVIAFVLKIRRALIESGDEDIASEMILGIEEIVSYENNFIYSSMVEPFKQNSSVPDEDFEFSFPFGYRDIPIVNVAPDLNQKDLTLRWIRASAKKTRRDGNTQLWEKDDFYGEDTPYFFNEWIKDYRDLGVPNWMATDVEKHYISILKEDGPFFVEGISAIRAAAGTHYQIFDESIRQAKSKHFKKIETSLAQAICIAIKHKSGHFANSLDTTLDVFENLPYQHKSFKTITQEIVQVTQHGVLSWCKSFNIYCKESIADDIRKMFDPQKMKLSKIQKLINSDNSQFDLIRMLAKVEYFFRRQYSEDRDDEFWNRWPTESDYLFMLFGMSQSPTRSENLVKAKKPSRYVLKAQDPETPWKRLWTLSKHKDREVRKALLQNPALCPVDDQGDVNTGLLLDLAFDFPDEAAEAPAFVLHAFYGDPKPMLRVIRRMVDYMKDPERVRSMFSLLASRLTPTKRGSRLPLSAASPDLSSAPFSPSAAAVLAPSSDAVSDALAPPSPSQGGRTNLRAFARKIAPLPSFRRAA